jgi:hypothetical protein
MALGAAQPPHDTCAPCVDGTGADARFRHPHGMAIDGAGNLYIADTTSSTIRKTTPAGVVATLVGTADRFGRRAQPHHPQGHRCRGRDHPRRQRGDGRPRGRHGRRRAVPGPDRRHHRRGRKRLRRGQQVIRKIAPTGTTTTLAGTPGVSGIVLGAMPRFGTPIRLAIVGDSIAVLDIDAVLLLRHGAR